MLLLSTEQDRPRTAGPIHQPRYQACLQLPVCLRQCEPPPLACLLPGAQVGWEQGRQAGQARIVRRRQIPLHHLLKRTRFNQTTNIAKSYGHPAEIKAIQRLQRCGLIQLMHTW